VAVLSSLKSLLLNVFDGPPPPPPKIDKKTLAEKAKAAPTAPELRFSDLEINDPADALRALRRATRTPPHQRHLDKPLEENMGLYAHHAEPPPIRPSETELRAVERNRRETPQPPRPVAIKGSSAA
jgi:hypothetical protein